MSKEETYIVRYKKPGMMKPCTERVPQSKLKPIHLSALFVELNLTFQRMPAKVQEDFLSCAFEAVKQQKALLEEEQLIRAFNPASNT